MRASRRRSEAAVILMLTPASAIERVVHTETGTPLGGMLVVAEGATAPASAAMRERGGTEIFDYVARRYVHDFGALGRVADWIALGVGDVRSGVPLHAMRSTTLSF